MTQAVAAGQNHFNVLIVGAGLSGIGAAVHLQQKCPQHSFAILEGRDAIGGTWDLFRYPGIRSDSDMYTLGYIFKPWREAKAIADGPNILSYIRETVEEHGLQGHIRFKQRVTRAAWSSAEARWNLNVQCEGQPDIAMSCDFLWICSGYYKYEAGYAPPITGIERFSGTVVHPQHWPQDLDYSGKRVVVIGSGATAVTLVPSMAGKAGHVTMLQRSPSYLISLPGSDRVANMLRRWLPAGLAYTLSRWKNVLRTTALFRVSRSYPDKVRQYLIKQAQDALGPGCDAQTHFNPAYNPWDQRMCAVPDGDMFTAIREGRASVVTDHIDTVTETGIRLKSGNELPADLIVTATGLDLVALGGIRISVDDKPLVLGDTFVYRGAMLEGVPNMAYVFGYTNASWTLKADLVSQYVCRLLNHMRETGMRQCAPRLADRNMPQSRLLELSSGYVERSKDQFPKQGSWGPWRAPHDYLRDIVKLRWGRLHDGAMEFRP